MNLRLFVRILRRGLWILLLLVLLGAGLGAAFAFLSTPSFVVQSTVYITLSGSGSASDLQAGNVFVSQKAPTFAGLASTDLVLGPAAATVPDTTTADLRASTSAVARDQAGVIDVASSGSDPRLVAARANAVAEALASRIESSSEQPVNRSGSSLRLVATVAQPAAVPKVATAPQPRYDVIAGALIGLIAAIAVIVVRQALDTRLHSLRDLPADRSLATRTAIPARRPRTRRADAEELQLESYRGLRANLQFGSSIGGSMAVAPVGREVDGAQAANRLCQVFLEIGLSVLLVDADFRAAGSPAGRRKTAEGTSQQGLAAVLKGRASLTEATTVESTPAGSLRRIRADGVTDADHHLLSTPAMRDLVRELERADSIVVLLCPPLTERADAVAVAAVTSTTIVVAEAGETRRPALRFALSLLQGVRAPSVSILLLEAQPD